MMRFGGATLGVLLAMALGWIAGCAPPSRFAEPASADRIGQRPLPAEYNPAPQTLDTSTPDLRASSLSNSDLSGYAERLMDATFDTFTTWPDSLPSPFDPDLILELGRNPGLGLKVLHDSGVTGRGVGLAVIDQPILVGHQEYADRLRVYEQLGAGERARWEGSAVLSIAAGRTVGVAPDADLYYVGVSEGLDLYPLIAPAVNRILEIDELLPADGRIRVLVMSFDPGHRPDTMAAIRRAEEAGILVISASGELWTLAGRPGGDVRFCNFSLEERVPEGHLLRAVAEVVEFSLATACSCPAHPAPARVNGAVAELDITRSGQG